jgi:hypothetical protein
MYTSRLGLYRTSLGYIRLGYLGNASASISTTLSRISSSITGTFTCPVYTGLSASALSKLTTSINATFTAPIYTGSSSLSTSHVFTSIAVSSPYNSTVQVSLSKIALAGQGHAAVPIYTGTVSGLLNHITPSSIGSSPYSSTSNPSIGKITPNIFGTFSVPTYISSISLALNPIVSSVTTSLRFNGIAVPQLQHLLCSGEGLFSSPVYASLIQVAIQKVGAGGSGGRVVPIFRAALSPSLLTPSPDFSVTFSFVPIIYSGQISSVLKNLHPDINTGLLVTKVFRLPIIVTTKSLRDFTILSSTNLSFVICSSVKRDLVVKD